MTKAVEYNLSVTNLNSDSLIHFETLISNGYLDKEKLKEGDSYCDGYVLIKEANTKPCYKIYLKCNNYISEGYGNRDSSKICN